MTTANQCTLIIKRLKSFMGRGITVRILFDQVDVGRLRNGEETSFYVPSGSHSVQIIGRDSNAEISIETYVGETIELECGVDFFSGLFIRVSSQKVIFGLKHHKGINSSTMLGHPPPQTNGSTSHERAVFISYAWGDEREALVNEIESALNRRGLRIIRDKRDLEYKGSIKQFMERIGNGDCVIVVISDKYLRSPNCMFELVEVAENKQFQDRVFPVIWNDANIYDPIQRIDYIRYWEVKRAQLAKAMKKLDPANLQGIREEIDLYDHIRDKISGLTTILKDMNALTPEMHQESNFSILFDSIEKRMKENET